jgi:hypothetical protein
VLGWTPALTTGTTVASGADVYAAFAPSGDLRLRVGGKPVVSRPAFGWAAQFPDSPGGQAHLSLSHLPLVPLGVLVEVLVWLALAIALLGLRWRPGRARRRRLAPDEAAGLVEETW